MWRLLIVVLVALVLFCGCTPTGYRDLLHSWTLQFEMRTENLVMAYKMQNSFLMYDAVKELNTVLKEPASWKVPTEFAGVHSHLLAACQYYQQVCLIALSDDAYSRLSESNFYVTKANEELSQATSEAKQIP